eukprot:364626-Chlamydomonas_euryale.AAC.6
MAEIGPARIHLDWLGLAWLSLRHHIGHCIALNTGGRLHVMLFYDMVCHSISFHPRPFQARSCGPWHGMAWHRCHAMPWHDMTYMAFHGMAYDDILDVPRHAMPRHTIPCGAESVVGSTPAHSAAWLQTPVPPQLRAHIPHGLHWKF